MNRFRRSAVTGATRAKKSPPWWLVMGLPFLAAATAPAQVILRLNPQPSDVPLLRVPSAEVQIPIAPPEVNFFGSGTARGRAGEAPVSVPAYSWAKGYEHMIVFRDGRQLRGTIPLGSDDEVLLQRPDASEVLRFPASAVRRLVVGGAEQDSLIEYVRQHSEKETPSTVVELCAGEWLGESALVAVDALPLATIARSYLPPLQPPAEPAADVLIFKNGDELPGTALSGNLQGPVRWRTHYGQEVDFQPERIAGLRLIDREKREARQTDEEPSLVELRTGERLCGRLLELDDQRLRLAHALLGTITLDHQQLRRIFSHARFRAPDDSGTPNGWKWAAPDSLCLRDDQPAAKGAHWVRFDGAYLLRTDAPPIYGFTSILPGWQHAVPPELDRFELRFRISSGTRLPGYCAVALFGDDFTLSVTANYHWLTFVVFNPPTRTGSHWPKVRLDNKLPDLSAPRDFRFLVDKNAGTCHVVINGVPIVKIGKEEADRLVKTDYFVRLQPFGNPRSLLVSNLQILPWNGDVPSASAPEAPSTLLSNGDVMTTAPKALHGGKWALESELGPMELPTEKILAVDFGGAASTEHTTGRVRLVDGSSVNVDTLQWNGEELNAHHPILGNIHVPLNAVSEIVFDPAPPNMPAAPEIKEVPAGNVIRRKVEVEIVK